MSAIRLITEPTIIVLGEMKLRTDGLNSLLDWVQDYRPECVPSDLLGDEHARAMALFPHDGYRNEQPGAPTGPLTDNEMLVELAGRNCYLSYGQKAGRKSNAEYIAHTQSGSIPHASIMYHAKMTFFLAGISRRVSHELIRHYVGADRSEEGSPSQESTRYTFHPGHFAVPPYVLDQAIAEYQVAEEEGHEAVQAICPMDMPAARSFQRSMEQTYHGYLEFIAREEAMYRERCGRLPTGLERKRIYEAAAGLLPMQACTSLVWTTNPLALAKLFRERCDESADREFQRLAKKWRSIAIAAWPNLFQGSV